MDFNNLCYGCFTENTSQFCRHCGMSKDAVQPAPALPYGTVLNGKYMSGKLLEQDAAGFTYLGFDLVEQRKVLIKEYFPVAAVLRADDRYDVLANDAPAFQSALEDFLEVEASSFRENRTAYSILPYVEPEQAQAADAPAANTFASDAPAAPAAPNAPAAAGSTYSPQQEYVSYQAPANSTYAPPQAQAPQSYTAPSQSYAAQPYTAQPYMAQPTASNQSFFDKLKTNKPLLIGVIAGAVVIIAAIVLAIVLAGGSKNNPSVPAAAQATATPDLTPEPTAEPTPSPTPAPTPFTGEKITNKELAFTMLVPSSYEDSSSGMDATFVKADKSGVIVTLMTSLPTDATPIYTLEDYIANADPILTALNDSIALLSDVSRESCTLNGMPAYKISATVNDSSKKGLMVITAVQAQPCGVYTIIEMIADTAADYEGDLAELDCMAESFTITGEFDPATVGVEYMENTELCFKALLPANTIYNVRSTADTVLALDISEEPYERIYIEDILPGDGEYTLDELLDRSHNYYVNNQFKKDKVTKVTDTKRTLADGRELFTREYSITKEDGENTLSAITAAVVIGDRYYIIDLWTTNSECTGTGTTALETLISTITPLPRG